MHERLPSNPYAPPQILGADERAGRFVESDDSMMIEFERSPETLCTFNLHYYHTRPLLRRRYWRAWITTPLTLLVLAVAVFHFNPAPFSSVFAAVFLTLALYYAVRFPISYRQSLRSSVEAMLRESKNLGLFGPLRLTIDPRGIHEQSAAGELFRVWEAVERIETADNVLMIYTGYNQAILVPLAAFPTPETAERFRQQALRYWQAGATA